MLGFYKQTPPSHRNSAHKTHTGITMTQNNNWQEQSCFSSFNMSETIHCSPTARTQLYKWGTNSNTATWHIITSLFLENKLYPPPQNLQKRSMALICSKKKREREKKKEKEKEVFPLEHVLYGKIFSSQHLAPISSGNSGSTVLCWISAMLKWPNYTHFLWLKPSALNSLFFENAHGERGVPNMRIFWQYLCKIQNSKLFDKIK